MREVVWSSESLRDFDAAILHMAKDSRNTASIVADRIEAAVALLAEIPIGHPGRVVGTYEKRVLRTPYIIAYALTDDVITIVRIIHERQNWPSGEWPDQ